MDRKISVVIVGAAGKMGRETVMAIHHAPDLELLGVADKILVGEDLRKVIGEDAPPLILDNRLGQMLDATKPDVLIDFTHLSAAPEHALSAIKRGISPVIGTSGLSQQDVSAIRMDAEEAGVGAALIPNFAVGAVLMMRFAELAAPWMPEVEIIEAHHKDKLDAPSGTALHTAERIQKVRENAPSQNRQAVEKVQGARGARYKEVQVHSVRLPGFVASQEVIFGGAGERLLLRHDSIDRASFMEGVKIAVRKVRESKGLVIGLDKLML
ncbi:MAG: 4-hydroxy-tetrahydrodipicolinate reductase [Fimbriimonadaceae bacterium]|jgi:4-hydroxy-tetrahydrodipicolinate reductase|nr:4-hydroxy-tetrahydrodipicolinate reductase [Fimbriimonadaceae bacterium]